MLTSQTETTGINPLIANPDELIARVSALKAEHAHIHPPQIAALLKVPEASLVACEIGIRADQQTVYRMAGNVPDILAPLGDWGRVLTVFANPAGVFMPLKSVKIGGVEGKRMLITGEDLNAELDHTAITDSYLVIQRDDMHGDTRSLQFYDRYGNAVIKIYLFNQEKLRDAKVHCSKFKSANQSRTITPASKELEILNGSCGEAGSSVENAVEKVFFSGAQAQVNYLTSYARVNWQGKMNKVSQNAQMVHIHSSSLRAHLRLAAITRWVEGDEGQINACSPQGILFSINLT